MIQGSVEWHAARCGKVTASRIADIIAKTKSGISASRASYMGELIAERLTGKPAEGFVSDAMKWGMEHEAAAREAYSLITGESVQQVGFIDHPTIRMSGASPDGLFANHYLVEIKCPNTSTHLDILLSEKVPTKYVTQMTWQGACTGRTFCDFVSYDPRLPLDMQLFVQRIALDPAYMIELEREVVKFILELEAQLDGLRAKYRRAA
jgi:putative phage-type endonuclease